MSAEPAALRRLRQVDELDPAHGLEQTVRSVATRRGNDALAMPVSGATVSVKHVTKRETRTACAADYAA
jgi:hypothetical protein